jgi:hypothetical protein
MWQPPGSWKKCSGGCSSLWFSFTGMHCHLKIRQKEYVCFDWPDPDPINISTDPEYFYLLEKSWTNPYFGFEECISECVNRADQSAANNNSYIRDTCLIRKIIGIFFFNSFLPTLGHRKQTYYYFFFWWPYRGWQFSQNICSAAFKLCVFVCFYLFIFF